MLLTLVGSGLLQSWLFLQCHSQPTPGIVESGVRVRVGVGVGVRFRVRVSVSVRVYSQLHSHPVHGGGKSQGYSEVRSEGEGKQ